MHITPVIRMIGEKRGAYPEPGITVELIGAHELRMDHHVASIIRGTCAHQLVGTDHHIDRGIAVGVGPDRHSRVMNGTEDLLVIGLRYERRATPVLLATRTLDQHGFAEIRRAPLRRTIAQHLDSTELEVSAITAKGVSELCFQIRRIHHQRQRHHIEPQRALLRRCLEHAHQPRVRGPVLDRGVAIARILLLHRIERRELLRRIGLRQRPVDRHSGGLHQQSRGLLRAGLAHDHPTLGCGCARIDAGTLEPRGVQHQSVPGNMQQQHRVIRECRIEVITRDMALLREPVGVITVGQDPVSGRRAAGGGMRTQHLDQRGNAVHAADRRNRHIGPADQAQSVTHMTVTIDESRQQGSAREIEHPCGIATVLAFDRFPGAERENPAILDRNRLDLRLCAVNGDDIASAENAVRDLARRCHRVRRRRGGVTTTARQHHAGKNKKTANTRFHDAITTVLSADCPIPCACCLSCRNA